MSTTTTTPPPVLQQGKSTPSSSQFLSARPAVSTTPSRDGRSRSNYASSISPPESITYDNFNDVMAQR